MRKLLLNFWTAAEKGKEEPEVSSQNRRNKAEREDTV